MAPPQWQSALGEQVRALRVAAGITQAELADRIGTSQPAVAHLEGGRRTPTLVTLQKLAQALGRDVTLQVSCQDTRGCELL